MGDDMISVLDHNQSIRALYMKQNLPAWFPVLANLLTKFRSFRPKMLKESARQKGTYCIQCILEKFESKNLLSFNVSNASEEAIEDFHAQFEEVLNSAYANSRTFTGSVNNKKVTENKKFISMICINNFESHLTSKHPTSQSVAHTTFFVKSVEDVVCHVGMYHLGILHKSDSDVGVHRIHNKLTYNEVSEWHRNYKFQIAKDKRKRREEHDKEVAEMREKNKRIKAEKAAVKAKPNLDSFIVSQVQSNDQIPQVNADPAEAMKNSRPQL